MNEKQLKKSFGRRLKDLRRSKGYTQQDLAEQIQVSPEFISRIERGEDSPSFETIAKLGKALRAPVWTLFRFDEQK